jgi:hypothetical protein
VNSVEDKSQMIAERTLFIQEGDANVEFCTVRLWKPQAQENQFTCRYSIEEKGSKARVRAISGADALSALHGALFLLGVELDDIALDQPVRLTWGDGRTDLGFPIPMPIQRREHEPGTPSRVPEYARARRHAQVAARYGRLTEAIDELRATIEYALGWQDTWQASDLARTAADLHEDAGLDDKEIWWRERAIALSPHSLVGHYELAKTYHRIGNEEGARLALSDLRVECERAIEQRASRISQEYLRLVEEAEQSWSWRSAKEDR